MSLKMLVIFQRFQSDDIPIYGHNEQEDKRPNTANQRQKRVLDNEQFQQSLPSTKINQ